MEGLIKFFINFLQTSMKDVDLSEEGTIAPKIADSAINFLYDPDCVLSFGRMKLTLEDILLLCYPNYSGSNIVDWFHKKIQESK